MFPGFAGHIIKVQSQTVAYCINVVRSTWFDPFALNRKNGYIYCPMFHVQMSAQYLMFQRLPHQSRCSVINFRSIDQRSILSWHPACCLLNIWWPFAWWLPTFSHYSWVQREKIIPIAFWSYVRGQNTDLYLNCYPFKIL